MPHSHSVGHPRYQLVRLLGAGGMGCVYEALDRATSARVALKTLRADSGEDLERFEQEMRTLSQLHHPGIVQLVDVGRQEGTLFYAMEYLDGVTLQALLGRPLPGPDEIGWILRAIVRALEALEYVHRAGIVHGDLKPSNIMVVPPSGSPPGPVALEALVSRPDPDVKLLDFGLARMSRKASSSRDGYGRKRGRGGEPAAGTPLYMAPEQVAGRALTERSDLYSIGALLYHLITQRPPYTDLSALLTREDPPPPAETLNPACPGGLSLCIASLLDPVPHRRPAAAGELAVTLRRLARPEAAWSRTLVPRLLRPVFVGRTAELEVLDASLRAVASGTGGGRVLRIAGEQGAGKTWLLHDSGLKTRAALDHRVAFLSASFRARAGHAGAGAVLRAAIELLAGTDGAPALEAILPPRDAEHLRVLGIGPHGAEPQPAPLLDTSPDGRRERALQAAIGVLDELLKRHTLVLALEDIEEASELEVELLARLARSARERPLLLVVSYRPEGIQDHSPARAFLSELDAGQHPAEMLLSGFTDRDLAHYVEAVLSPRGGPAPALLEDLVRRSATLPPAVHRRLRFLLDSGALENRDGTWVLAADPASLSQERHAADRLAAIPDDHRRLLSVAALFNAPVDAEVLAGLLGEESVESRLSRQLADLVAAGCLLDGPDGSVVAPELGGLALEEAIEPPEARSLHERAAQWILAHTASPADGHHLRIAEHLLAAGLRERAARHFREAGRLASSLYANRRALDAFRRALELTESPGERAAVSIELGDLYARSGRYEEALESYRRSESLEPPPARSLEEHPTSRLLELWDRIGSVLQRRGELDAAQGYFERCIEAPDVPAPRSALACYRLGGVAFERNDLPRARRHYERGLELLGPEAPPQDQVALHAGLALVEKLEGRPEAAIEHLENARAAAEACGQLAEVAKIHGNLANLYRVLGDTDRALEALRRSTEVRELVGDRQGLAICLANMARAHVHRGEFTTAEEATTRALSLFREVGDRKGILIAQCNLGEILVFRGRIAEAREVLEGNLGMAVEMGATRLAESNLLNLGRLETVAGRTTRAEAHLRKALGTLPPGRLQGLQSHALSLLAEVLLEDGRLEEAGRALEEAWELARSDADHEKTAELASVRVRLCRRRRELDAALELGAALLRDAGSAGERYGLARLDAELGATYRDLGPEWADRTERHLGRAVEEFERMGCPVEAAESLAALAVYWSLLEEEALAGECVARARAHLAREGLEHQERRVFRMVKEAR